MDDRAPTPLPPASSPAGPLLALAISPAGHAYLESSHGDTEPLAPATATRIRQAFDQGAAHGLLHLGAAELGQALPASLAFGLDNGRRPAAHRETGRVRDHGADRAPHRGLSGSGGCRVSRHLAYQVARPARHAAKRSTRSGNVGASNQAGSNWSALAARSS